MKKRKRRRETGDRRTEVGDWKQKIVGVCVVRLSRHYDRLTLLVPFPLCHPLKKFTNNAACPTSTVDVTPIHDTTSLLLQVSVFSGTLMLAGFTRISLFGIATAVVLTHGFIISPLFNNAGSYNF
jgi:hypothetical protein